MCREKTSKCAHLLPEWSLHDAVGGDASRNGLFTPAQCRARGKARLMHQRCPRMERVPSLLSLLRPGVGWEVWGSLWRRWPLS